MDYSKIYNNLVNTTKNRILNEDVYKEKHHIIPRCVGGTDEQSNLVDLTFREHVLAHRLLCKIYPDKKLLEAYGAMRMISKTHGRILSYTQLESIKKANSLAASIRQSENNISTDPVTANKISKSVKNHWDNMTELEYFERIKLMKENQPDRSGKNNSMYGRKHSEDVKKAQSERMKGRLVGENHPKFKGYIFTPLGKFASFTEAAKAHDKGSGVIQRRCKSDKYPEYYTEFKSQ